MSHYRQPLHCTAFYSCYIALCNAVYCTILHDIVRCCTLQTNLCVHIVVQLKCVRPMCAYCCGIEETFGGGRPPDISQYWLRLSGHNIFHLKLCRIHQNLSGNFAQSIRKCERKKYLVNVAIDCWLMRQNRSHQSLLGILEYWRHPAQGPTFSLQVGFKLGPCWIWCISGMFCWVFERLLSLSEVSFEIHIARIFCMFACLELLPLLALQHHWSLAIFGATRPLADH